MISQKTILEVKVAGRVYELYCDPTSPLADVSQAIVQMHTHVAGMIENESKKAESLPEVADGS